MTAEPIPVTSRRCSGCWREFVAFGAERKCSECRKGVGKGVRLAPVAGRPLSDRQIRVAALIHEDLSNKDIAAAMGISGGTLKGYVFHLKAKLAVNSRVGVALFVERGGLDKYTGVSAA